MHIRRIALVTALALGLVTATTGIAAAKRAPEGFHNVSVKRAGFKIAIPDEWEIVNLTRGDVQEAFDNLTEAVPGLANQFPGGFSDLVAQSVVLFAAVQEATFNPNMNVVFQEGASLPSVEEVEQGLATIVEGADVTESRVDGADAIKATYELDLGPVTATGIQYTVESDEGLLAFTFTTSTDNPLAKTFKKMAKSIDLA